jgi:hypothetical protein
VRGHLAYVASWDAGLEIFEVADPTNLVRLGHCDTPGLARGVHVVGGLAYVADQAGGLQVMDVRNPRQPFWLATAPTLGSALGVRVSAGKAYVAASGAGLEIFDVSDPLWVVRLGRMDTPGVAEDVELTGTSALVADYNQGLKIIDVSNPFVPTLVGEFAAPGDSFHVQVVSNLAYVAQGVAGLDAVAATNPAVPLLTLVGQPQASVHAAAVSGKHAFLADRTRGFVVAELLGVLPGLPQLEESPESTEAVRGSNLVLSVVVSGTPPLSYQWYKDGVGLSGGGRVQGVSEPHLRVNNLTNLDAGAYFAVVSSPYGAVTSGVASVTVSAPGLPPVAPAIGTQPVSQSAPLGGTVTFQAQASGSGPLTYRWSLNGQALQDGPHYWGATTASLVVSNVTLQQEGIYQLKVWNSAGAITSLPVTLISVLAPGAFFYDDFVRPNGTNVLAPWQVGVESWTVVDGALFGVTNGLSGHAMIYVTNDWTDYSVEVRASIPANGFGWFVGGRLNPLTGEYYEVFLYGNYDAIGPWRLHLTKHVHWGPTGWDGVNLAYQPDVEVSGAGTTSLHSLKITFQGNRILVHYDGSLKMDVRDDNFPSYGQPWPAFASGGIIVGMYATNDYVLRVEDVIVRQVPIATNLVVVMPENSATNLVLQGSVGEGTKTFAILGAPTNGILSGFDANAGTLTYKSATNYLGTDSFTFAVSDGTLMATGVVHITVNGTPPVILSLTRVDPTNVVIAWSAISNRTYRLFFADDMTFGNWISQTADVTASGPIASTTNAAGAATQRFYRVLRLP